MVQGLVDLQKKQTASGKTLPLGMSAAVEVTCKQAKNAIVVPAQALYEPAGQSAYVYVLNAQDQPEKREVEIGLRTVASAEVKSGLSEGEKVITSTVEQ
jgi:multidrug efflux pump subunit AcrA (membrane-fusion protein)